MLMSKAFYDKINIRRKEKMEKVTEFAEKIKRVQEEVITALKKIQKEMK